ncbi:MAG: hypothetical protein LRY36_00750 [Alphaproteobacteria bacterium]|nr:hypothetical protein [Alphaproteobacteria bacterium]
MKDDTIVMQKRQNGEDEIIMAPAHIPIVLPDNIPDEDKESERKRRSADDRGKREELTRLKMLIRMRDLTKDILDLQHQYSDADVAEMEQAPWVPLQDELKSVYEAFIPTYGAINRFEIRKSGQHNEGGERGEYRVYPNLKKFRKDADAKRVAALVETYDDITGEAVAGPIFSPRMVQAKGESIDVHTSQEALGLCLSEKGVVDFAYIAQILKSGVNADSVQKELSDKGRVFFDPATDTWEISEVYLSGNVRQKLREAEEAASTHKSLGRNVKALKKVMPPDRGPNDIDATLGVHWIPADILEEFAASELGIIDPKVFYYPRTHSWFVKGKDSEDPENPSKFATDYFKPRRLFQHALADTQPGLTHQLGDDGVTVDVNLKRKKPKKWSRDYASISKNGSGPILPAAKDCVRFITKPLIPLFPGNTMDRICVSQGGLSISNLARIRKTRSGATGRAVIR